MCKKLTVVANSPDLTLLNLLILIQTSRVWVKCAVGRCRDTDHLTVKVGNPSTKFLLQNHTLTVTIIHLTTISCTVVSAHRQQKLLGQAGLSLPTFWSMWAAALWPTQF